MLVITFSSVTLITLAVVDTTASEDFNKFLLSTGKYRFVHWKGHNTEFSKKRWRNCFRGQSLLEK